MNAVPFQMRISEMPERVSVQSVALVFVSAAVAVYVPSWLFTTVHFVVLEIFGRKTLSVPPPPVTVLFALPRNILSFPAPPKIVFAASLLPTILLPALPPMAVSIWLPAAIATLFFPV